LDSQTPPLAPQAVSPLFFIVTPSTLDLIVFRVPSLTPFFQYTAASLFYGWERIVFFSDRTTSGFFLLLFSAANPPLLKLPYFPKGWVEHKHQFFSALFSPRISGGWGSGHFFFFSQGQTQFVPLGLCWKSCSSFGILIFT